MFAKSHRFSFLSPYPRYTFSTEYFTLRYQRNEDSYKVAVIVGKKVSKKAVIRNRLKRRLREILKNYLSDDIQFSLVLYLKKPIDTATNQEIHNSLEQAFSKIGIIKRTI